MGRPFAEISAEMWSDHLRRFQLEREVRKLRRRYDRPWWRVVRGWDRLRAR